MTALRLAPGLLGAAALGLSLVATPAAAAVQFSVTNLVSDGTVPAVTIDPALINPWGVSFAPTGPFWVSDAGAGVSTLYNGAGTKLGLTVTIPPSPSAPTGQVFNSGGATAFQIGGTKPLFIFDTEDGVISGWAPTFGTTAQTAATSSTGAIYKGLAIGSSGGNDLLYAADFHNGVVEKYTNNFSSFTTFTDPTVAPGYAPFNAQVLGGELYVTFALRDASAKDDVSGAGFGYVDVFNLDGSFNRRIASLGDEINSPWGLAIAPPSFHELAGSLLVGNFGDGTISAFDPTSGAFKGKLLGLDGLPLAFGDLWALTPGNGAAAGDTQKIYFTAALFDEAHGLFGELTAIPEPGAWMLMILGFGLAGTALRTRSRTQRRLAAG
jgi:uncharacterized protein (TIGR03118 family)